MRHGCLAFTLVLVAAVPAKAEWYFKPFIGFTFAGSTKLSELDEAEQGPRERHLAVGGSVVLIGEVFGVEADIGWAPGFFERDAPERLVSRSRLTTLTGNVVVAMPRRMTRYTLRPYAVAGFGLVRASVEDALNVFGFAETRAAIDVGGGVTGFFNERVGVSWDVRYFRSVGGPEPEFIFQDLDPQVTFWRANMALTLRY
jgi:hypothetical protein